MFLWNVGTYISNYMTLCSRYSPHWRPPILYFHVNKILSWIEFKVKMKQLDLSVHENCSDLVTCMTNESMESTCILHKFWLEMYPFLMGFSVNNLMSVSVFTKLQTFLIFLKWWSTPSIHNISTEIVAGKGSNSASQPMYMGISQPTDSIESSLLFLQLTKEETQHTLEYLVTTLKLNFLLYFFLE
jgi:hypothetical protein